MFPEILDIQLIVASYVSDDFITLINLSHLWKIADLDKLYNGKDYFIDEVLKCDTKLHQYIDFTVDLNVPIPYIPRNMKSIYLSGELKKAIEFLDNYPVTRPKINLESFEVDKIGNLFNKYKFYKVGIHGTVNKTSDFLKDISCDKIELCANFESKTKLTINKSVSEMKIYPNGIYPELSLSNDSALEYFLANYFNKNISDILEYYHFKNLKTLELSEVGNLGFLKNPNLEILSNLTILRPENKDILSPNIINGKIYFPLQNLSLSSLIIISSEPVKIKFFGKFALFNTETLKKITMIFPTKLFDFCIPDEFGRLQSIFHNYNKLESFSFEYSKTHYFIEDSKSIINFLPSVKELIIKIGENEIDAKIHVPESVNTIKLIFEGKNDMAEFLSKVSFENILNVRKFSIIADHSKFVYLPQHGARIFSEMKKLETIQLAECGFLGKELSLTLPDLLEQLPDSLVNIELMDAKIDSGLKYIDFRKFRKLQYLNISIMCENEYQDPIIYLPTGSKTGILQAKIEKLCYDKTHLSFQFKNIRGLYISVNVDC